MASDVKMLILFLSLLLECLERLLHTELEEDDDYRQVSLNFRFGGRQWTTNRTVPFTSPPRKKIRCPTCMTVNPLQNNDVSSLTKNFALLGCVPQSVSKTKHFCLEHSHDKRIYCSDCRSLICAYCQLYGEHAGHSYVVASDASKTPLDALKVAGEGLLADMEMVASSRKEVDMVILKLARNRRRCERSVKKYYNGAIERLEREKSSLLSEVATWTEEQVSILNAQSKYEPLLI